MSDCKHELVKWNPLDRSQLICDLCGAEFVEASKLEAQRIDHPTDICECRFDFSDGVMKVRKQCAYHKGIADRLDRCLAWCDREIEWLSRGPTAYGEGRLKSVQEIKAILVENQRIKSNEPA